MTKIGELLKSIYEEASGAVYHAGTLCANGTVLNPESHAPLEGYFKSDKPKTPYTASEKYWWAKCYVKYKTPDHSFYAESVKYVEEFEEKLKHVA